MIEPRPRKLLVRGVNWLGDAVMTTPALIRLREALPETRITLLTRAKLVDLWRSHPALNNLISIEPGESVWALGGKLRAGEFDTSLVLPNSPRSALEVWLGGIPRRIGYDRPWRNGFLTDVIPTRAAHVKMRKRSVAEIRQLSRGAGPGAAPTPAWPRDAHQMHDYLHLVAALGASQAPVPPRLSIGEPEIEAARAKFDVSRTHLWLGINAGAEYGPAKRWPEERFVGAVQTLQDHTGCGCLIFGAQADQQIADQIAAHLSNPRWPIRNLAGQTSLRELMALFTACRVLLTNDTGPMHVAAALGIPVVVPFGSTSPELTGPGLPEDPRHCVLQSDAPCSPCFLRECPIDFRCMTGIRVERVVEAVIAAWNRP